MTGLAAAPLRRPGWDFVGRDREVAELVAGLEDALDGHGRLFLIAGEPGIGKTGLSERLAAHAEDRGARVVWGRCWEGGGAPPYWPWAQVIRAIADECDAPTLTSWLGTGAAYIGQMAPDLADRLGASAGASGPSIDSDAARFYVFQATAGFLKKAAAAQPLMLIFEDLHAADDPSLLLLKYLARDLRSSRLLVLGTYRDVEVGRAAGTGTSVTELVREGHLTTLRGLTRDDVRDLIGEIAGAAPSEAVVQAVHETTEGNPLFVREAVRLLASAGTLTQTGRPEVPIPGSVRALIQQRLTPLSVEAVQVLAAASVVGRDFDLALVGPACNLSLDRVLGAVSEAMSLGVLVEESVALGRYRFSHSLMREVIYEALPIPVRAGLHRAVGEGIERLYGADSDRHIAELARHFAEVAATGESAKALTYARRAGDRAMQAHGYEDAAVEYQRALHALEIAAPDATGPDPEVSCELLLRLGAAQVRAGRYPEAKEIHLQAAELARRLHAPDLLATAALGYGEPHVEGGHVNRQLVELLREALNTLSPEDSPLRARLLARLSVELTFSDEVHLTDALSRESVEIARRLGHDRSLGDALDARWMAVWGPDGRDERAGLAGEMMALAQKTGDRDLELRGRPQRVATSLEAGDFLAAEADMAAYARLTDELRMPVHQWATTTMRAMRALLQGSLGEVECLAKAGLALQPERPSARWAHLLELTLLRWEQGRLGELREVWQTQVDRFPRLAIARSWLALADLDRGDRASAQRALSLLAEQIPVLPRSGVWTLGVALASLLAAELDDAEAARRIYPALLPYASHVIAMNMEQPVVCFGSASLYLAVLATAASEWTAASKHFEAAIREHERLGAAPLLAHTRYHHARMLLRRGEADAPARAGQMLDRASATAEALGLAGLTAQIATLRDSMQSQSAAVAEPAPPLVQREATTPDASPATTPAAPVDVPPEPASAPSGRDLFRREGEYWTVSFDGLTVRLKDSKGLRQIALLLGQPGREMPVTDLEAMVGGPAEPSATKSRERVGHGELETRSDFGDAGEMLDAEARAAYKARLDELKEEIDEAEDFNDPERAERARGEREFLIRELARAVGLGGRDRKASSHAERARLNATRAIRAAMANLGREHPSLGQHLEATVRTGRYCSYTPDPRSPVSWEL